MKTKLPAKTAGKALISGGAGFIGSHLCDELLARGYSVVAVDDLSLGRLDNLAVATKSRRFQFVQGDLNDYDTLLALFRREKFDLVFHLAANSDIAVSRENPLIDYTKTFLTTFNILRCMKETEVKKLVFASTSAIYGETEGRVGEAYGPLVPISHYGAGKLASEAFIDSFTHNYGMQSWIVRFPNVVGGRATHGVIFDFIQRLRRQPGELVVLGDGNQQKPYLYVKDLVGAMLHIQGSATGQVNIYNVGVGSATKVSRIAKLVVGQVSPGARITYTGGSRGWIGDVPKFQYDLSRVHRLGWRAAHTSDQAVRKAIAEISAS